MKVIYEKDSQNLVDLQPIGMNKPGGAIPVLPANCADDAPC